MEENEKKTDVVMCLYNTGVDCTIKQMADLWVCTHCGWNPQEQERRKTKMLKWDDKFNFKIKK